MKRLIIIYIFSLLKSFFLSFFFFYRRSCLNMCSQLGLIANPVFRLDVSLNSCILPAALLILLIHSCALILYMRLSSYKMPGWLSVLFALRPRAPEMILATLNTSNCLNFVYAVVTLSVFLVSFIAVSQGNVLS